MTLDYDPYRPGFYLNPRPVYQALRDEAPAYWSEKHQFWALSRYDDVRGALKNWQVFGNEGGFLPIVGDLFKPNLQMMDPPKHTRLRKVLSSILSPDKFLSMENSVRSRVVALLAPFERAATMDLTQNFAAPLPSQVIADLLGVPAEDAPILMRSVDLLADYGEGELIARTQTALDQLNRYYEEYFAIRRGQQPRADVVQQLISAVDDNILTQDEAVGFAVQLTIAGGETTTKLIGNMAALLVKNPAQRQLLLENPALLPGAIEEALRFDSPTHMLTRILNQAIEMHGQSMQKGQLVALIFNAANNDERKFTAPDTFDIGRGNVREHLAFAGGPHACLGAPLARLETRVAFEEILRRWPQFDIIDAGLTHFFNPFVKGFRNLPIRLR
jgi:cytochrome P450